MQSRSKLRTSLIRRATTNILRIDQQGATWVEGGEVCSKAA